MSAPSVVAQSEMMADEATQETVVVTASRVASPASDAVVSSVSIEAWSPDRPYLKALDDACGSEFDAVYYEERKTHGALPSFYLEMADARFACGEVDATREIALSALELEFANSDTRTAVANRLMTYGDYDLAILILEQVVADDESRPQPFRDLALALELAGQSEAKSRQDKQALYSRAIELLNHVVETPWTGDYDGIELISVMEANRIRDRLQAVGGEASLPDKALEKLLPVDLRIVAAWNVDSTDMDLWVDEATGERSYYGNQLTAIGGRLSNDMTRGYGPEEYLLKTAIPGEYEVRMNYFGSDIVNPNGAVVLRTHIFRNWGRANETVEVVDLEFISDTQDDYLVAKITVE